MSQITFVGGVCNSEIWVSAISGQQLGRIVGKAIIASQGDSVWSSVKKKKMRFWGVTLFYTSIAPLGLSDR